MSVCLRTLALWQPGTPLPGVEHNGIWTGSMPNTGRLLCYLCGKDLGPEEDLIRLVTQRLTRDQNLQTHAG